MDLVRRIAAADPVTLDLLDRAVQRKQGERTDLQHTDNVTKSDHGNERTYALRRLRKDRPDLHARVLEGVVSAHAAMVEAGFRRKTITVPADVDAIVRALPRHFSGEDIKEIARRLGAA
jgi:hypothetical protein